MNGMDESNQRRRVEANRPQARCANPRHPNGKWHLATPEPLRGGWQLVLTRRGRLLRREARAYDHRRNLWGCGCIAFATGHCD